MRTNENNSSGSENDKSEELLKPKAQAKAEDKKTNGDSVTTGADVSLAESRAKPEKNKKIRKPRKARKILLAVLCVFLSVLLLLAGSFAFLYFKGKSHYRNTKKNITAPENVEIIKDDGSEVKYNEQQYVYNDDIVNILVMGIDNDHSDKSEYIGSNGQADALYLVILNTELQTASVLPISRDTVTYVDKYSRNGTFIGQEKDFICRSFAYGDGEKGSCLLTLSCVARTLFNIPIQSYVAIDMDAIPVLCDSVGGVSVPEYNSDMLTKTGNMIELTSKNALEYVRSRTHAVLEANSVRMEKQKYFINAFSEKMIAMTKNDLSVPLNVYSRLDERGLMITNISASDLTYLVTNFISGLNGIRFYSVPGTLTSTEENEAGAKYAQFYIDEQSLYEVILELFYVKK